MSNSPIEIIDEFLTSESPQRRRNALTALASLNTPEAIRCMVQSALEDKDGIVRVRAEEELAKLDAVALDTLQNEISALVDDKSKIMAIYTLLGRLKDRGLSISLDKLDWLQTLLLEIKMFRFAYPERGWKFYFRTFIPALKASFGGILFYSVVFSVLWLTLNKNFSFEMSWPNLVTLNTLFFDMIWWIFWMPFITVLITLRTSAIHLYTNRLFGIFIELFLALLGGALIEFIAYLEKFTFDISLALAMVMVRLCSLYTGDIEFKYLSNQWVMTLTSSIAGALVIIFAEALDFEIGSASPFATSRFWSMAVLIPALANAYAVIETREQVRSSRRHRIGLLAVNTAFISACILIIFAFIPESPCIVDKQTIQNGNLPGDAVKLEVARYPYCSRMEIGGNQKVGIDPSQLPNTMALRVLGNSSSEIDETTVDPENNSNSTSTIYLTKQGSYTVIVAEKTSALVNRKVNQGNALPILLNHYARLFEKSSAPDSPYQLAISNN